MKTDEPSSPSGASRLVLVVDDEPHIREVVVFALRKGGFDTIEASGGREAIARFEQQQPDLVVLDIVMPDLEGTEVCRRIRAHTSPERASTPIIFLSSRDEELDRVLGLELGGDDYVTKPFSPRELTARVRAVLRRHAPPAEVVEAPRTLVHGRLRLDLDRHKVFWGDVEVTLTVTEFGIVRTLMGFPGKVFSRDELMDRAYADEVYVSHRTIDSHVRRVRSKLAAVGADPIETVHGVGYSLGDCR